MSDLADRFRREGMADAAVLLVAKRVNPTADLDDWGRHLNLTHQDLTAAVDRFKGRLPERRPRLTVVRTGGPRRGETRSSRRVRNGQIVARHSSGEGFVELATAFGLTPQRIRQIILADQAGDVA